MSETTLSNIEFELKIKADQKHLAEKVFASLEQRFALLAEMQALTVRLSVANAAIMVETMATTVDTDEVNENNQISFAGRGSSSFQNIEAQVDAVWKIANEMNQVRRDLRNQENHLAAILRSLGRTNAKINGEGREYDARVNGVSYTLIVSDGSPFLKVNG